jgi:GNAT superfamily N-acetyltransferase
MSNIVYRHAVVADAPAIVEFQLLMARETEEIELDRATVVKGVNAVFADATRGHYFVAELDGAVVASLMITHEWSDWRNGDVWWIQSVFVTPTARGKGIYKGLYEHIQQIVAADEHVRGIRLYVDKRNTRAQAVYSRLGMDGEHYQVFEWMK